MNNLIEELEALVRIEKSSIEQFAYLIMLDLLLVDYWHEQAESTRERRGAEITEFRLQLNKLTTNLHNYLSEHLDFLYDKARKAAIKKN